MSALITAQEVIDIAFASNTNMSPESISDVVIHIAERKYIKPALGGLYDELQTKQYHKFAEEYIKPALAYFVKCEVMPSLAVSLGNNGIALASPQYMTSATDKQRQMLYDSELHKANLLLNEAVEYIHKHIEDFPMFNSVQRKQKTSNCGFIL